jgi:hypothetical protein
LQRVLSTVVPLGLLLACAAAFAVTEHLKLIKSDVYATHVDKVFSPTCRCPTDTAMINFTLRKADTLTVSIVDRDGNPIDTLASNVSEPAASVTFRWDGRTSDGTVAPDGLYHPQIALSQRTIVMPNLIAVDTTTPTITSATLTGDPVITPGGHPAIIRYVLGQKAHAALYVNGRRIVQSRSIQPNNVVKWFGKVDGKALPAGTYSLSVGAVDLAGNETPPSKRKTVAVQIADIAVGRMPAGVAPGARFTVSVRTGAQSFSWTFAGAHGTSTDKKLQLRAPSQPGQYRLVVSEHGHSASTVVTVGRG